MLAILALVLSPVLWRWARLAWMEDLHSHVVLVPFISWYLIRLRASERAVGSGQVPEGGAPAGGVLLGVGGFILAVGIALQMGRVRWGEGDLLAVQMLGVVLLAMGTLAWCHGAGFLKANAFALGFLLFMVPMPSFLETGLEIFFQNASALAAHVLFRLTGTTFLRDGLSFELPGLSIMVAQECSGIRSTYVLLMVSLLAGHLFLRANTNRVGFALCTIPLGILRNGFRIVTISLLTIYVDPAIIHGPLHHRGGPVFFALSLFPFFALLWWLRARELKRSGARRPDRTRLPADPAKPIV